MDPARPSDPDPADPFFPERADHAILETIEIATEGENHHQAVRKLRGPLMKINGVHDVKVDLERNFAGSTGEGGDKHAGIWDVKFGVARRQPSAFAHNLLRHRQRDNVDVASADFHVAQTRDILLERLVIFVLRIVFSDSYDH